MRAVHDLNEQDLAYFAGDYNDARRRFLESAQNFLKGIPAGELTAFQVPSRQDAELYADFLSVPAVRQKKCLLVMVSGVHGIEGFTGSAIQRLFLDELAPRLDQESTGLFLVHALNPFGFKYIRRATESNVNLNRNFATDPSLFASENPAYDRVVDLLTSPRKVASPRWELLRALGLVATALAFRGFNADKLNRGIALGQYRHPQGLEFGGKGHEPQTAHYLSMLKKLMAGYESVILLDLHTGLGETHTLHLIPGDDTRSTDPELLEKLFAPLKDNPAFTFTPSSAEGFYETLGDMNQVLKGLGAPDQKLLSLTLEFGTLGNHPRAKIASLHRIFLENQAYHHGTTTPDVRREVTRLFTELFFPSDPKWRMTVLQRARATLGALVERLDQRQAGEY